MRRVKELSITAFDGDKLVSSELTVVDFTGVGAAPGVHAPEELEELAAEFEGRCRFCRFDAPLDAGVSTRLGIAKPSIVLYEHGIAVDRLRSYGPVSVRDAIVAMVTRRLPVRRDDDCADGSCLIPP